MSSSACRELPGPRARSAWRAERLGGRPSPPPLATAPCWPMQRDTAGAAPASLRAAGRRPKRPLPSGDPTPRRSRARRECGARAISVPGHAGRSDMGSQAQNSAQTARAPPLLLLPPPLRSPRQTRCRRSRRHRRRRLAPRLRHRRPPSRGGVPLMARAPRSPAPRRCPPLAAAPLVAAASPVNPAVRTTAATASRLAAAAAALPLAAERCLASLLTRPGRAAHSLCTLSPSLYSDCAAGAATHAVGCLGQRREPPAPTHTRVTRPAAAPLVRSLQLYPAVRSIPGLKNGSKSFKTGPNRFKIA